MNDQVNEIAMNLETLVRNLSTVTNLMSAADDVDVSASRCAGLVIMIQEQMHEQVDKLYRCNGKDATA